ncbi:MAG: hypothetical protein KJI69_05985 [Patescibacteria group bacterium]|nr:hypothetical protein [Patescibacteria group bacterium]
MNSGGDNQICINPGGNIEDCFFCVPQTCSDVSVECGNTVERCGLTLDCGSCASGFTCTAGSCVADVTPPAPGAGAGVITPTVNINVNPTEINLNMVINTVVGQVIRVTNLGTSTLTVSVSQQDLDNMVILETTSLALAAGETKDLSVRFVAPGEAGIYTGKIIIGGKTVSVALNVKTKLLLFDSNIVVLNDDYKVPQGQKLKTQVTLIPLGDKERLDITLNYEIKDYAGKIYLTKSETLLVEDKVEFKRDFDTGMLPLGKYIIGLELIYTNGVAPSSAHFEVIEPLPKNILSRIVFFLIILILIIAILILILMIIRSRKKKKMKAAAGAV